MHLGWRFTPVDGGSGRYGGAAGGTGAASFVALIVDYLDTEEEATGRTAAFNLLGGDLRVGMQAPAWMAALLLTVTQGGGSASK